MQERVNGMEWSWKRGNASFGGYMEGKQLLTRQPGRGWLMTIQNHLSFLPL
jgi:hypothetical protein